MRILGIGLGSPRAGERAELVQQARAAEVTYTDLGATLDAERSAGAGASVVSRDLGVGPLAFETAVEALRAWAPQRSVGAEVEPPGVTFERGATVVFVLRRGPVHVIVPNRIVAVIDEATRFGFAYGTLPGHPERGEEGFIVELLGDGTVRGTIRVVATAPNRLAQLVLGPAISAVSSLVARRYLRSLQRAASA